MNSFNWAYVAGLVVFGLIGLAALWRAKKTQRMALNWMGLALLLFPLAVSDPWLLWGLGGALSVWLSTRWNR